MNDRCVTQGYHHLVIFIGSVFFLDQIPGAVEAACRKVFVGSGEVEIGGLGHGFTVEFRIQTSTSPPDFAGREFSPKWWAISRRASPGLPRLINRCRHSAPSGASTSVSAERSRSA